MKKKREYKPAGVKARITLEFWLPGVSTLIEAQDAIIRCLKVQGGKDDYIILLGGTEQQYRLIEEKQAVKLNLPARPSPSAGGEA